MVLKSYCNKKKIIKPSFFLSAVEYRIQNTRLKNKKIRKIAWEPNGIRPKNVIDHKNKVAQNGSRQKADRSETFPTK